MFLPNPITSERIFVIFLNVCDKTIMNTVESNEGFLKSKTTMGVINVPKVGYYYLLMRF